MFPTRRRLFVWFVWCGLALAAMGQSLAMAQGMGGLFGNWEISADALYWTRATPSSYASVTDATGTTVYANPADKTFDFQTAPRIEVAKYFGNLGIDVVYFGCDAFNASKSYGAIPASQYNSASIVSIVALDNLSTTYRSELQNGELNLKYRVADRLKLISGFRYMELNESYYTNVSALPTLGDIYQRTDNRLYGFQIGGSLVLWQPAKRLSIEGSGKAGIFDNYSRHRFAVEYPPGTPIAGEFNNSKHSTAFTGEAGLAAVFRITDRFTAHAGYQFLWLSGVALASDQIAETNFISGGGIRTSGSTYFHGANAGLTLTW